MARFGLIGAWAPDCGRRISSSNPMTIFAAGGFEATTQLREGDSSAPTATGSVEDAAIIGPGLIRLRNTVSFALSSGILTVVSVTRMDPIGRIQVVSSVVHSLGRSQTIVANGRRLLSGPGFSAGDPTPWLERCASANVS